MSEKIEVYFEASASGYVEICPDEVEGMTADEIEAYVYEGAELLVNEQLGIDYYLRGMEGALEQIKEAREAQDKDNG